MDVSNNEHQATTGKIMTQTDQDRVRQALEQHHPKIREAVELGYSEWRQVQMFRAKQGFGSVLYARTEANDIFDAVVRNAMRIFSDEPGVRIVEESQTVKFCFSEEVLLRFKKGDENNLGRNLKTQAVLDFVNPQGTLPGLPPEAEKVEVLYAASEVGDRIESILVVARDGDRLLWHYEIDDLLAEDEAIVPLFGATIDSTTDDEEPLVKPRKGGQDAGQNKQDQE
ncbi:hypothetical protein XM52_17520 [Roseovarius indicus]|uniref:Uncharacterized protein n=1 Tax=Roseovarius indicus TaxID=540747 RepID=A0A0T5P722_9RHOB|nr:hypothetical protein XM52_17520 [Roseovarius indicus]